MLISIGCSQLQLRPLEIITSWIRNFNSICQGRRVGILVNILAYRRWTNILRSVRLLSDTYYIWTFRFALNLIYYGISMNVAKFGGDLFVNYAASSSAELLAILFCWYTTNKIGRKKLFCTVMILGGVTCTSTIFTYLYANECE